MLLRENVSLAPYTTFRIGGPARWLVEATDEDSIVDAVQFSRDHGAPLFVLGGGSNLLVSDEGFAGLVLHVGLKGVEQDGDVFRAAAGENWDDFVGRAVGAGYGGVECLAGIPGTVGGTPVQNVGAYGQEVAETIVGVRVLDVNHLRFEELPASQCGFAYRRSIFNSTERGCFVVTRVDYKLRPGAAPLLRYPDLQRCFQDRNASPTPGQVSDAVREIRHRKGMLLVEGEADCRSAGSFFKNPVVGQALYDQIAMKATAPVPCFPAGPDPANPGSADQKWVKIPAAWLVEHAGFHKGFALGRAGISSRHTLALINRGGATAAEIVALRDRIVATVEEKYAIRLEAEPVLLGSQG